MQENWLLASCKYKNVDFLMQNIDYFMQKID